MGKERDRYIRALKSQLDFLQSSCDRFDSGHEDEALRIATTLRTLFRDGHGPKSQTVSVLTHLDMRECPMLASEFRNHGVLYHVSFVNFQVCPGSPRPVQAKPFLGNTPLVQTSRSNWWEKEPVFHTASRNYTRRDLVLVAAEKEGGVHLDSETVPFYAELEEGLHGISLVPDGLIFNGPAPYDKSQIQRPHGLQNAMIRQFGHEVLATHARFKWGRP